MELRCTITSVMYIAIHKVITMISIIYIGMHINTYNLSIDTHVQGGMVGEHV